MGKVYCSAMCDVKIVATSHEMLHDIPLMT